jgi:hypothetical protein
VDEEGKPLRVFHGTTKNIEGKFDTEKVGGSTTGNVTAVWGSFFTPSSAEASRYATEAFSGRNGVEGARVLPTYLSMKNPYKMTRREWDEHAMKVFRGMPESEAVAEERAFRKSLERSGYDGIIIGGKGFNNEFVVFSPNQIKSVTGNSGAFSPTNPDIRGLSAPAIMAGTGAVAAGGLTAGAILQRKFEEAKRKRNKNRSK